MHLDRCKQTENWPNRRKSPKALSLIELSFRYLNIARRVIVDDDDACYEVGQILFVNADILGYVPLDHQSDFNFVIQKTHTSRLDHCAVGRHDTDRRLREHHVVVLGVGIDAGFDYFQYAAPTETNELLVPGDRGECFNL